MIKRPTILLNLMNSTGFGIAGNHLGSVLPLIDAASFDKNHSSTVAVGSICTVCVGKAISAW